MHLLLCFVWLLRHVSYCMGSISALYKPSLQHSSLVSKPVMQGLMLRQRCHSLAQSEDLRLAVTPVLILTRPLSS